MNSEFAMKFTHLTEVVKHFKSKEDMGSMQFECELAAMIDKDEHSWFGHYSRIKLIDKLADFSLFVPLIY